MAGNRNTPPRSFYEDPEPSPEEWPTQGSPYVSPFYDPTATERYDPLADLRQRSAPAPDHPWPRPTPRKTFGQRMAKQWPLWTIGALVAVMGLGVASAVALLRIPNLPNCRAIFWPAASATTRIQCAEAFADQGTVEGYLEAIALIEALPPDHPLRGEISQRIETWADRILDLAEQSFQAGQWQEAITMARRIPNHTAAAQVVGERVEEWNQIWQEAETIYAAAETQLKNLEFQEAFTQATQLLKVRNTYWNTVKYDELTANITAARETLNELGRAKRLADQRTLAALREAIAIAQEVPSDSPLHGEAQKVLGEFGGILIEMAENALNRRNADEAQQMLSAIPSNLNLGADIADMRAIIEASQLSWQGGITGLEGGVSRLQSLDASRPRYGLAQRLIGQWRAEIEGRTQLEWAQQLALGGTAADLQAAITEAEAISRSNPMWDEAKAEIDGWRNQVETAEDRPILEEARQFARLGDLNAAMATARRIGPGRALHGEAQDLIRGWRGDQERTEDGPLLAQAQQMATAGQYQDAIAVASRIGRGRALYDQAQGDIATWRRQVDGQQQIQRAYQLAQQGSVSALVDAIQAAQQVPEDSPQRPEAVRVLNRWSFDLLRLAESEARLNPARAAEIAAAIPPQTEAYAQAQLRLREWQVTPIAPPTAP
ncbi:MAG: chromosome segregation ATPase [Spirulina sp.]